MLLHDEFIIEWFIRCVFIRITRVPANSAIIGFISKLVKGYAFLIANKCSRYTNSIANIKDMLILKTWLYINIYIYIKYVYIYLFVYHNII